MKITLFCGACLSGLLLSFSVTPDKFPIRDEKAATAIKQRFVALTDGWAKEAIFTQTEKEAMQRGRQVETLMTTGLDDPLARRILEAGEPSYDALAGSYPGKILDRTVLGSYSDPGRRTKNSDNEFIVWWNGAISAHLIEGQQSERMRIIAANTNIVFRVGTSAEMFGKYGESYSRIGYEDGYLPMVRARYEHDGIRYEETVVAANREGETTGEDTCYVRFQLTNVSASARRAALHAEIVLADGSKLKSSGQSLLNASEALILDHSEAGAVFDQNTQRITHSLELKPDQTAAVFFRIPYLPDPVRNAAPPTAAEFDSVFRRTRDFWTDLLSSSIKIKVPEERVNEIWRALLLQNFILADGPRFTYGAGLWYNSSYFPVENGMATNDFAFYGFGDYSQALLPFCMQTSIHPDQAGRKYQNRRGVALHHLYENYRLARKMDVFNQYRKDLLRVADEIIADRKSTMVEQNAKRPLHWGLLPPDRPGADDLGGKYTMYVLAHNITSCQGLQDFGNFLVKSGADRARGEKYLREADDFRKTILAALKAAVIRSQGRPPFVPLETLYFKETPDYGPEPYDDLARGRVQGTYYHYWADMELGYNFFDADDPLARWITDYLEMMGGFVLGCTRGRHRPAQEYGWINNVYNSGYYNFILRRGEIDKFLLGFYSRFAFGMSRHAYVASEGSPLIGYNTRDGGFVGADYSFPNSAANSETLRMLRAMLILEELKNNEETGDIYLARGVPRAWFDQGKRIEVADAPSYFGNLSFTIESRISEGLVRATIRPPVRDAYKNIVISLRHPGKLALRQVKVNGRQHRDFDSREGSVRLPAGPKEFVLEAFF
jgi:hypothetical protein